MSTIEAETTANEYLKETAYINFSHPKIQWALHNDLNISSYGTPKEKAIAIHDYVRDTVLFGFNRPFFDMTASQVLEARRGFCNNKSTLFAAMLRAIGIPARQIFVDIDTEVLHGFVSPPTKYVDHSYVEVYLNERWIKCDSYIVDPALFREAVAKLKEEKRSLGWGCHVKGTNSWDGESDSFSQFFIQDAEKISTKEYGVYEDVKDFYERAENTWNKPGLIEKCFFFIFAGKISSDIDKLRKK